MSLADSKTLQNLKDAFSGESQANRRYLLPKATWKANTGRLFAHRQGETARHGHLNMETRRPATGPIGAHKT